PGCGKKDGGGKKGDVADTKKSTGDDKKGADTSSGSKKALDATLDAVIMGQVTYDGEPPAAPVISDMEKHKDKDVCLMGKDYEKGEQRWIVSKSNKGVANVVISLKPPE